MVHCGIIISIWFVYYYDLLFAIAITSDSGKIKNDGILSVSSATTSSITLNWTFPNASVFDLSSPELKYRLRNPPILPPSFQWNHTAKYYSALDTRTENEQWSEPSYVVRNISEKSNEIILEARDLGFPNQKYEFEVRIRQKTTSLQNSKKLARIVARTKPDVPRYPTKTGAGSFRIYDQDETSRQVKIYTQENYQYPSEVRVYEDRDGQTVIIHSSNGSLDVYGTMWMTISLKRNYFIFKHYNRLGASEESSIVNVPPQDEILSASLNTAIYNKTTHINLLRWCRPENVNVTNYTIFWVDNIERNTARSILDFVHLSADVTSFQVKGKGFVKLGLSANTETSSSGLQIVQQIET